MHMKPHQSTRGLQGSVDKESGRLSSLSIATRLSNGDPVLAAQPTRRGATGLSPPTRLC
jgi:hypothetical protein